MYADYLLKTQVFEHFSNLNHREQLKITKDDITNNLHNLQGENLFYENSCIITYTGKRISNCNSNPISLASKRWIDEKKDYNYKKHKQYGVNYMSPELFSKVGHYTQIVSKDTTEVGIAIAKNAEGLVYVVARYLPKGNINIYQSTPY